MVVVGLLARRVVVAVHGADATETSVCNIKCHWMRGTAARTEGVSYLDLTMTNYFD